VRFRKKPVVIEAVQFHMPMERPKKPGPDRRVAGVEWRDFGSSQMHPCVVTLEGRLHVSDGDWIITGIKGEFYPCKPDIFEATYESVADAPRSRFTNDEVAFLNHLKTQEEFAGHTPNVHRLLAMLEGKAVEPTVADGTKGMERGR